MTFERWFSTLPKHRREVIEESGWVKEWMQEAWRIGTTTEQRRCVKIVREFAVPNYGTAPTIVREQIADEIMKEVLDEAK